MSQERERERERETVRIMLESMKTLIEQSFSTLANHLNSTRTRMTFNRYVSQNDSTPISLITQLAVHPFSTFLLYSRDLHANNMHPIQNISPSLFLIEYERLH
jgi:hypothetical protein